MGYQILMPLLSFVKKHPRKTFKASFATCSISSEKTKHQPTKSCTWGKNQENYPGLVKSDWFPVYRETVTFLKGLISVN